MTRWYSLVIGLLILVWLLTLGVHHESYIRSTFTIAGGDAWNQFEAGNIRAYPHINVSSNHADRFGVPFLFASMKESGPFNLSFSLTIHENAPATALQLDEIKIDDGNGEAYLITFPEQGIQEPFELDELGSDRGEIIYKRAYFRFEEALIQERDCILHLSGSFITPAGVRPYQETIELDLDRENYTYIGWIALMLQAL